MRQKLFKTTGTWVPGGPGRPPRPENWITGPDEYKHELYYSYLRHRAQAIFRKESYELSWEEYESLWTPDTFEQRGRGAKNLSLYRVDPTEPWSIDNCQIITRREYWDSRKKIGLPT